MLKCKICEKKLVKKQKSTCSWKCRSIYVKRLNTGRPSPFKGKKDRWTDEQKKIIGEKQRGRKLSEAHKLKIKAKCKPPSRLGIKFTTEERLKQAERCPRGSKHYKWKGGITSENIRLRHSIEYKLWRGKVFKRDNWTCQGENCNQRGGNLEAHHIKPWRKYPELRFAENNGITYCVKCHKHYDKYRN